MECGSLLCFWGNPPHPPAWEITKASFHNSKRGHKPSHSKGIVRKPEVRRRELLFGDYDAKKWLKLLIEFVDIIDRAPLFESRSHFQMKRIKKIAIVTGSRAEYGILSPLMKGINAHSQFHLLTIVVGMHLSSEFGNTVEEIERDSFKIDAKISSINRDDTHSGMARYIGRVIIKAVDIFEDLRPDMIILLGDRADILATTIAASYMNLLIAHIHGGDITKGGLDEPARHAITKFAHIHFPATEKSAKRIIKMGEEPWRVFVVGALGLDSILKGNELLSSEDISKKYGLNLSKPILLVLQHPITTETNYAPTQMEETLKALVELQHQTILIYPNADPGGKKMIAVIKRYEYPFIKKFKSLPHIDYLSLMGIANVMVGNSSSGIIEAPSFKLPVVNIGIRQKGRERSTNVIDVPHNKEAIKKAIEIALYDKRFIESLKDSTSPYGDGHATERIIEVLNTIKIDRNLLQKQITEDR